MSLLIGLLAGVFGGLLGVGGGIIMIPLMVGFLKIEQIQAHGTSLVAVAFTGIAGAIAYGMHGSVDWTASALLALTAMTTAQFGARFANDLPEWKLKRLFGGFVILIAALMLTKPYLHQFAPNTLSEWLKIVLLLVSGTLTGFLSGMMGVGGGTVMVPAMVLLLGFSQHTAQGSSLLAMIPAGGAGGWAHWKLGNIHGNILMGLIPGVMVGTYIGGNTANLLPDRELRYIFSAVLVWTGLRYIRTRIPAAEHP